MCKLKKSRRAHSSSILPTSPTGVDGHLRSHRWLLMEWPNNSWIAPAVDFEPPAALPRRSVTRPHFFSKYIRHGFMASAIRSCQLIATDVRWRPRQRAREHEYSSAFRKEGFRGCERVRGEVKGDAAVVERAEWSGADERTV